MRVVGDVIPQVVRETKETLDVFACLRHVPVPSIFNFRRVWLSGVARNKVPQNVDRRVAEEALGAVDAEVPLVEDGEYLANMTSMVLHSGVGVNVDVVDEGSGEASHTRQDLLNYTLEDLGQRFEAKRGALEHPFVFVPGEGCFDPVLDSDRELVKTLG